MAFKLPDPKPYPKTHISTKLRSMLHRLTRLEMSELPEPVASHVAKAKAEIEAAIKDGEAAGNS